MCRERLRSRIYKKAGRLIAKAEERRQLKPVSKPGRKPQACRQMHTTQEGRSRRE